MAKLVLSADTEGPWAAAVYFGIQSQLQDFHENPDVLPSLVKISYPGAPEPSEQTIKTKFRGVQRDTPPV